ncbi:MAG: IS1182 family transposase [Candidatus Omnitrophica bacterium]|nr:IS1182 family transposase [Candidatus Omnitrophota bacterium]
MARYKRYSYDQSMLIPVNFHKQILSGTFEYALSYIIDNELNLSVFASKYKNDQTGAPAYDPAIMLKIILYAYSKGVTSSREIEKYCHENIIFVALSADTKPHFTTIADFISSMKDQITPLFRDVLLYCQELDLIDKTMFAIDGCKISSNASKEWSGTRKDYEKKIEKFEKTIEYILEKHQKEDVNENTYISEETNHIENIKKKISKIKKFLEDHDDKKGPKGNIKKSNITDNESAKMPSSHGVVQGYNGVAIVDGKHQIIVHAESFGQGQESQLFKPMIENTQETFESIGDKDALKNAKLVADSGFHSKDNIELVEENKIDAYIADNQFRKRDPRFATAERHKKPINKNFRNPSSKYFQVKDFKRDEQKGKLICPAGKELYIKNRNYQYKGSKATAYSAKITDCRNCKLRNKCLRNKNTKARQVHTFHVRKSPEILEKMRDKIDSTYGKYIYTKRMQIVEPVFANIRSTLRLDKFSLRSKTKVNIQWNLFAMVHNIGKIFRYGPQFT